jgi:hypothetical protein
MKLEGGVCPEKIRLWAVIPLSELAEWRKLQAGLATEVRGKLNRCHKQIRLDLGCGGT